jgi:hypothetical protein
VKKWFAKLDEAIKKYKINRGKKLLNMDEFKVRVSYFTKELVIILITIKEVYTTSLKNRKSLTIIKTIRGDKKNTLLLFY